MRCGCAPHLLPLADERVPEQELRLELVVRAAAELDVVRRHLQLIAFRREWRHDGRAERTT
jgi:hypothetical protein